MRCAGTDPAGLAVRSAGLKMVGGVRGAADEARLHMLQAYAQELRIADSVEVRCTAHPRAQHSTAHASLLLGTLGARPTQLHVEPACCSCRAAR